MEWMGVVYLESLQLTDPILPDDDKFEYIDDLEEDLDGQSKDEKRKRKSKHAALIGRRITFHIPLSYLLIALILLFGIFAVVITQRQPQTASDTFIYPTRVPALLDSVPFCSDAPLSTNDRIVLSVGDLNRSNLFLTDPSGEHACRLTQNAFTNESPSWSPDGTQIAFASSREGQSNIFVMNADGLDVRNLTKDCVGISSSPDWSPDGKYIIFESTCIGEPQSNIYRIDADGSNIGLLTDSLARDTSPRWSPNGQLIAFVSTQDAPDGGVSLENYEIYIMTANGRNVRRITNDQLLNHAPTWSSRGDGLIFTSVGDDTPAQLFEDFDLFGVTSSGPELFAPMPPFSSVLLWLPDDKIAFLGYVENDKKYLYLTDTVGISREQYEPVTNFADIMSFDWWRRTQ